MTEFDSVIPAGQSGKLTAKIKTTTTQSGPISKSIAVTTNAAGAERMTLSVAFTAVSAITVLPRPQIMINGVLGDEPTATLIFHRPDGEKLEITGFDSADEQIVFTTKAVAENLTIDRSQAVPGDVLVIASLAPGVKPATTSGQFKVHTNHPDAPVVTIAFSLRLRPVIEANPAEVRLLLQEGNTSSRTMLFRVQNNFSKPFKLTGSQPSSPEIFRVQLADGEIEQQTHTVAVMLQDDVIPGSIEASLFESLVLSTNDAAQPEVIVPVLIEPRELRKPGKPRPLE